MGFVEKLRQSLRWRSSFAYYGLLRRLKSGRDRDIPWRQCAPSGPRLISCVYTADIPLLRECVRTLHEKNALPPRVLLVGDSPEAAGKLRECFADAGNAAETAFWKDLFETLSPAAKKFVESWLGGGPFGGYARKFAVTLAANASGAIVMCDADVLFGGDFFSELRRTIAVKDSILAGEDYRASYDIKTAEFLGEARILQGRPLNCGVVYYPSESLNGVMTDDLLSKTLPLTVPADNHLEQTLVAYAFWRSGGAFFPREILETSLADNLAWSNGLKSAARHYAGGKHLFWRDV